MTLHGYPEVAAELITAEIGPPLDEIFIKYLPEVEPTVITSLISTYRERYAEVGYSENELYPGVSNALRDLTDRGVRLGVCTSKRKDFAEKILSLFGLIPHFSFIDGGDIGIKKREQLAGLIQSGTIDQSAIMIGDREVDISAAKANGLRSIGVLWGFGDINELSRAGADIILSDPNKFVGLVSDKR